jgi:hypothetical protein
MTIVMWRRHQVARAALSSHLLPPAAEAQLLRRNRRLPVARIKRTSQQRAERASVAMGQSEGHFLQTDHLSSSM